MKRLVKITVWFKKYINPPSLTRQFEVFSEEEADQIWTAVLRAPDDHYEVRDSHYEEVMSSELPVDWNEKNTYAAFQQAFKQITKKEWYV